MIELDYFYAQQRLHSRRMEAFGDASALYHYRFQNDNGSVNQMEQARRYVAQDKEWYLSGFQSCDLLIRDDFGMERQTDYAREQVFNIIDGRYLSRKPLIVTTNLSLSELKHPKDMVEQRIFDRVLELCVPVCFDGESLRQEKAKQNMHLYRQLANP